MGADANVRARINAATKERAATALDAMGLSISDAIRLLMVRVADEQRFPFAVEVPNASTRRAIKELEAARGKTYGSTADMMKDLGSYAPGAVANFTSLVEYSFHLPL
jgi:DNA-damage-inducible protein J